VKKNDCDFLEQLCKQCNDLADQTTFLPLAQELIRALNIFLDINYFALLIRKDGHVLRKAIDRNHIIIGHNTVFHNTIWKIIQSGITQSLAEFSVTEEDVIKDFLDVSVDVVNLGKNKAVSQNQDDNNIVYSVPLTLQNSVIGALILIDTGNRTLEKNEKCVVDFFAKQFLINFENRLLSHGLKEVSVNDNLTDTFNRKYFIERFRKEFSRAKRFYTPLTMILAEIQNLKDINENHGHQCGDLLLTHIADIFKETIRSIDLIGRNKGSEFIMLLPHTKSDGAVTLIKRIRKQLQNDGVNILGKQVHVDIRYGISSFPDNSALDPDEFLKSVEEALDHARSIGADSLYVFSRDSINSIS
jgi:diguanylate cyclase (GGDEF)-like protein